VLFVCSYELVNEVSDETRFHKRANGVLKELRNLLGDALFTVRFSPTFPGSLTSVTQAEANEPNWGIARKHCAAHLTQTLIALAYRPPSYACLRDPCCERHDGGDAGHIEPADSQGLFYLLIS
jgi:hypothetical protein